jgi:lathosterol oxidase
MFTWPQLATLLIVAVLGHAMALLWYVAATRRWRLAQRCIYNLPFGKDQIKREWRNSIHAPIHAIFLGGFVWFGFFQNATIGSFVYSGVLTTIWAEIWHYVSHRVFHVRSLHWIHAEHHKSHINSPLSAMSFSFVEKFIFDLGILLPLAALDGVIGLNLYGIAAWYIGYLIINSFSHANFELKSARYNRFFGQVLTTTTYHSLHHARYTGNYGLGTRVLDRIFNTEWIDYEKLYDQVVGQERPLKTLRDRADGTAA